MVYLILLKQLSQEKLEAKLMGGGLSNIPPMALMNFLRILLIRIKDFGWRKGDLRECIPVIELSEWPQIASHCTNQEFDNRIKLKENPRVAMANQATGRQTPVREYCQFLNTSLRDTVNRNGSNQANNSGLAQVQSAFTPYPRPQIPPGPLMRTDPPMIARRAGSKPLSSMQVRNTNNRVNSINSSLNHPTTTTTSNIVNTISRTR